MKNKKQNNKIKKYLSSAYTWVTLISSVVLYMFAFMHYDIVDINSAVSYDVVISNVEYGSDRGKAWATFNASGMPVCYVFESRKAANMGDYEKIEELAAEKIKVKIILTDYKDWLRLLDFDGRKQVADIRTDDEVIFDVSIYNSKAKTMIVFWSVIATVLLVSSIANVIIRVKLKI